VRVLLIDPPDVFLDGSGETRQVEPLGLAYVASSLSTDHDVRLLLPDTRSYTGNQPWDEIATAIQAEAPEAVGISLVSSAVPSATRLIEVIRKVAPGAPVVVGGVHPTVEPAHALLSTGADFAVQGEAEVTARELFRMIEAGPASEYLAGIPGVWWRDDSRILGPVNRASTPDVSQLPWPQRDGLVWPEDIQPGFYQSVITARGCNGRCTFCAASTIQRGVRFRPACDVRSELGHLAETYGTRHIFFHDSVFTANARHTRAISTITGDLGLTYDCQTRADRVEPGLLEAMATGGCGHILMGIESGDFDTLKRIKKNTSPDQVVRAVNMIRKAGIRCSGFFMTGWPWDTEASIRHMVGFATSLGLDAAFLFSVTPLPGTELWSDTSNRVPVDFREPEVNLTSMPDSVYTALYREAQAQFKQYNERVK
jgi:anaerobic magnesium-protoporphyrin IX monomethyl ester cyclase